MVEGNDWFPIAIGLDAATPAATAIWAQEVHAHVARMMTAAIFHEKILSLSRRFPKSSKMPEIAC